MKRIFGIHGWEGSPDYGWWSWFKKSLVEKGFEVSVPAMPNAAHPKMDEWLGHLKKIVGSPDKNCFFVGHSLGCITILRFIEKMKEGSNIGGVILVAGFSDNLGLKEIESFFQSPINWEKIKSKCGKIVAIFSDDDKWVPLKHAEVFKEKLGAKIIVLKGWKHFSGDDGITEVPVVLEEVLKMAEK